MKIYLVGGAVRDLLMGIHSSDLDYVVVSSSVDEMLSLGYIPVGKDFPVFLHPITKHEYALARTERKISQGYQGFNFYTDKNISLEQDLSRRDLTINAMALPLDNSHNPLSLDYLIDPFNGKQDLNSKLLHHVSPAFSEDPVRILRIARFSARYNFSIANDTLHLMQNMVADGEVNALVAERIWQEINKGLAEKYPYNLFKVLHNCGALHIILPDFIHQFNEHINFLDQLSKELINNQNNINKLNLSSELIFLCMLLHIANLQKSIQKTDITKICSSLKLSRELIDI
ncbi:MAG: tRNA nucleotidyltransferase, partial [Pseudomonadota bacterium]